MRAAQRKGGGWRQPQPLPAQKTQECQRVVSCGFEAVSPRAPLAPPTWQRGPGGGVEANRFDPVGSSDGARCRLWAPPIPDPRGLIPVFTHSHLGRRRAPSGPQVSRRSVSWSWPARSSAWIRCPVTTCPRGSVGFVSRPPRGPQHVRDQDRDMVGLQGGAMLRDMSRS